MSIIKHTLYPKTKRLGSTESSVTITEKIDGSNLSFFKSEGELYVAQRNYIFPYATAVENTDVSLYKGLKGFLVEYGEELKEELQENSCICGEWIGMGRLSYGGELGKFVQFAKANVDISGDGLLTSIVLKNLYYDNSLFKWSYKSQEPPSFIGSVPVVEVINVVPSKEYLDKKYDEYTKSVGRNVEGFIVIVNNSITKYVRMKNNTLTEHKS